MKNRTRREFEAAIVALLWQRPTLLDLRRRCNGYGYDVLRLNFIGRAYDVAPNFGAALERLAFAGIIQLRSERGQTVRVEPGRLYRGSIAR